MAKTKPISLRIPEALYEQIVNYAHATKGSVQDFVATAVEKELKSRLAQADSALLRTLEDLRRVRETY